MKRFNQQFSVSLSPLTGHVAAVIEIIMVRYHIVSSGRRMHEQCEKNKKCDKR